MYMFYLFFPILKLCVTVLLDIEETDIESVSEGSAGDLTTLGDTSFFDFTFSTSKTDSLPFTVHDTGHSATRKSRHVCYLCLCLGVFC